MFTLTGWCFSPIILSHRLAPTGKGATAHGLGGMEGNLHFVLPYRRWEHCQTSQRAVDRGPNRTFWRLQEKTEPLHTLITGRSKAGQSGIGLAGKQETHTPTSPPTQVNMVLFLLRGSSATVGTWTLSLTLQVGSTATLLHIKPQILRS